MTALIRAVLPAALLACVVFSGRLARAEDGGAEIDVSKVTPDDCRSCNNTGAVKCNRCNGSGLTYTASLVCPECNGKKTVDCTECDADGFIRCKKCKKVKIGDETTYGVSNPEWQEWAKKYLPVKNRTFSKEKLAEIPEEPEKYIKCTDCGGEGKFKCPYCDGTKTRDCPKCKGTGSVTGRGPCPLCNGTALMACPYCAGMKGVDEKATAALDKLLAEKVIAQDEYFKRRRVLTAQAKYRDAILAKHTAEKPAETVAAKAETAPAAAETGPKFDLEEKKRQLVILGEACASGALTFKTYREKTRDLGLSDAALLELESGTAVGKLKDYVELKRRFRAGEIDAEEYFGKVGQL